MALIKCPECGREVSDTAVACPGCGYPIAAGAVGSGEKTPEPSRPTEPTNKDLGSGDPAPDNSDLFKIQRADLLKIHKRNSYIKAVAVIIGLLTTILYWVFADTPAQCVGKAVCRQDHRLMAGAIGGVLAAVVAYYVVGIVYTMVAPGWQSVTEDPKPGVSVGTKQNHPVVGAILGLISLAPAVVTGLFLVLFVFLEFDADVLPLPVDLRPVHDPELQPLIWFLVGCTTSLLGWALVMRTCFPERVVKRKNHPVVGAILLVISLAPLLGAGWFRVILPCEDEWDSYCKSADPMLWLAVGMGATILGLLFVYYKLFPERVARIKKQQKGAAIENLQIWTENRSLAAAGGRWDSVPKVVCPHCQEAGGVQHFTPYEAPRDLLKEGVMWHLTGKTIGHVEVTPAEKIGQDIREASKQAQTPNMCCTNCTIEWRV